MQTNPFSISATTAPSTGPSSPTINDNAVSWASERGLSLKTLEQLGVASGMPFFPDLERKSEAIFFKYPDGWKARSIEQKSFVSGGGFKLSFWNLDNVLALAPSTVFLVEGEADLMAMVEAGIPLGKILSVPNGAKDRPTVGDPKELRGYDYVEEALKAGLNRTQKFIWCGDNDEPGKILREDMVRLLGPARFHFVEWPDGIKDANEMLLKEGAVALHELVTLGSLPWPVEGIYRISELPEPPQLVLWEPGFPEWERRIIMAPRTLSVVTGHPGHGKTVFWNQIWFQICTKYDVAMCMASFETRPKPHIRRQLRTLHSGLLEYEMNETELDAADAWIDDHYLFMSHPEQRPTLGWFLDMAEIAVVRHGARIVQLDPWNRLEASREPGESETEYIGRCLRTMHVFAQDMNCHVQILAHPAKMDHVNKGKPPTLEDISGSKNWDNMPDQGFAIHRPTLFDEGERQTKVDFYHRKSRFDELGFPCKMQMDYDLKKGKFKCIEYDK